jgi:hypothetical protein
MIYYEYIYFMDTPYQRHVKAGFKAYFIAGFADYANYAAFA